MMRLLSILLTIFILSSIFFSYPQAAHAQSDKKPAGLLNLIILKQLLIAQQAMPAVQSATITATKPAELLPITTIEQTPTVIPKIAPTIIPTPTPVTTNLTTEVKTDIMNEINTYRATKGLSAVHVSGETCAFAKLRAEEISKNFNHDGFNHRVATKTLPYAHWSKVSENLATTPNYKEVVTLWKNSPAHAANLREPTPFVCIEQFGNYYAYEGMHP